MSFKTILLGAITSAIAISFSIAYAEDLYIIKGKKPDTGEIASLTGIRVYALLENSVLIGTDPGGTEALVSRNFAIEKIGERDKSSEYFLFQISDTDTDRLPSDFDLVYYNGKEAISRVNMKSSPGGFPPEFVRGLTRISFVPRPIIKRQAIGPVYEPFTDPQIQEIVDQVSEAEYTTYLQRLQDFVTRYSYTDSCRAAEQWGENTFAGFGLDSELWPYNYDGYTWYNAIGRKAGTLYPDSIYLVIGHIDAISDDPWNEAPGAEDNGSGSACVLEAARVMSQYDFDCTVEFVLVSGEELGLIGSEAYASYCYSNNRNIAGVLNFDMIAYTGPYGWDTNIYADQNFPEEVALADLLAELTDEYSDAYSIRVNTDGPIYGSDHYYFSYYGFPACFSIDAQMWGAPDWYPWYHTTDDVITHLNLPFVTEVVKGAVAALATLANPSTPPLLEFVYPDGLPEIIDPDGGTTFRVEVYSGTADPEPGTGLLHYSTGGDFTSVEMEVVSPNIYDAVFPALDCGLEISFYVSAETVDDSVVTDPPNAPERVYDAFSAYEIALIYEDDFSTDKGWSGLGGSGEWTIGPAMGGDGDDSYGGPDPAEDHSPTEDNQVLGNDLTFGDGDYEANLGSTYWVTSPVVDCSDFLGVTLKFYRWLGVERDLYDNAYLQAYNGSAWVTIFENGSSTIDDGSWTQQNYDVSAEADGNPDFQIRFGIGSTDVAWQYCGWNVDDIEIAGYSCIPPEDISTELIPDEDPTIVPQGGSFGMTASITNNGLEPTTTDVWFGAYRNTHWYQQHLYRDVPLDGGQTRQGHFSQQVPAFAPPGDYVYVELCGDYDSWTVIDFSYFIVTVTEANSPGERGDWFLEGAFENITSNKPPQGHGPGGF